MGSVNNSRLKEVISENLTLLMDIYHKSRREVCHDLDISYTTFCDWINARTYPRMESLEALAAYFRINPRVLLADMNANASMIAKLTSFAQTAGVCTDNTLADNYTPTANDYYGNPEVGPMELINGHFYPHGSHNTIHQQILSELSFTLLSHIKKNRIRASLYTGPFDIELPTTPDSIVTPDISIIYNHTTIDEHGCKGVPDVIMEISTPESFEFDSQTKQILYENVGVKEYWIIVPHLKQIFVYRQQKTGNSFFDRAGGYSFRDFVASDVIAGFTLRMSALNIDV